MIKGWVKRKKVLNLRTIAQYLEVILNTNLEIVEKFKYVNSRISEF